MSEILIKVRGSHSVEVPPERGVVHAEVIFDGPAPEPVMELLQHGVQRVRDELARLDHADAVEKVVIQRARTSAERPWHKDGKQLPLVHRGAVGLWAEFIDFDELAAWVGRSATSHGLTVNGVSWQLTKESRLKTEREVRQEAVRQAKVRAQDYADALDLGPVSVRSINDVGVSRELRLEMQASVPVADTSMAYSAPELSFDPDDITVYAEVEAAFTVGS